MAAAPRRPDFEDEGESKPRNRRTYQKPAKDKPFGKSKQEDEGPRGRKRFDEEDMNDDDFETDFDDDDLDPEDLDEEDLDFEDLDDDDDFGDDWDDDLDEDR